MKKQFILMLLILILSACENKVTETTRPTPLPEDEIPPTTLKDRVGTYAGIKLIVTNQFGVTVELNSDGTGLYRLGRRNHEGSVEINFGDMSSTNTEFNFEGDEIILKHNVSGNNSTEKEKYNFKLEFTSLNSVKITGADIANPSEEMILEKGSD